MRSLIDFVVECSVHCLVGCMDSVCSLDIFQGGALIDCKIVVFVNPFPFGSDSVNCERLFENYPRTNGRICCNSQLSEFTTVRSNSTHSSGRQTFWTIVFIQCFADDSIPFQVLSLNMVCAVTTP